MTKNDLVNLSEKSAEIRRTYLLRQNQTLLTHQNPYTLGVKVSPKVVSGGAVVNHKLPNQAMPVNRAALTKPGPYRTGDGDTAITHRPGAEDHKKYHSLVTSGTITYARGHA